MENVYLVGAEDVRQAGRNMQAAAESMGRSAASMDESAHRLAAFLDEWLGRLEVVLGALPAKPDHGEPG